MARVFVSFHHDLNTGHAKVVRNIIWQIGHTDITLNEGTKIQNEDNKSDESIRKEIRNRYLKDVDVTIVIVGSESIHRKHIDWEIRSSVHKFPNHRAGSIVVVNAVFFREGEPVTWSLDSELTRQHGGTFFRRSAYHRITR